MSSTLPRRTRIETGVYLRPRNGGPPVYEVGFYDEDGNQRWRTVDGDIEEARKLRAMLHNGKGRDRKVRADLLEINKLSKSLTPSKRVFTEVIRATRGNNPRRAWMMLAGLSLAMARKFDTGKLPDNPSNPRTAGPATLPGPTQPPPPPKRKFNTSNNCTSMCDSETRVHLHYCGFCKELFQAKRSDAGYCGQPCRQKALRRKANASNSTNL